MKNFYSSSKRRHSMLPSGKYPKMSERLSKEAIIKKSDNLRVITLSDKDYSKVSCSAFCLERD